MRINIYIHTLGGGGAEKALINMVNSFDREQTTIKVFTILNTGEYRDEIDSSIELKTVIKVPKFILKRFTNKSGTLEKNDEKSGKAIKLYTFFWKYFSWILIPITWYQNRNVDLVISYLEGPTHILISQVPTKAKKISWIHVDLSVEKKSELFFRNSNQNKKTYNKFDAIVGVSTDVRQSLVDYIGCNPNNISTITNVYDEVEIRSKASLNENSFKNDIVNFVSVGRLSEQKGYDRLIDSVEKLVKEYDNFVIRIYGDGELKEDLRKMVITKKLTNFIRFEGFVNNPYPFIKNSDVFIAPSRTEGYSTVVVESLILGTPVVVTECSGMNDILDSGKYGLIVENSTIGIYNGLKKCLENSKGISDLSLKASLAQNKYKKQNLIDNINEFLVETVKNESI